MEFINDFLNQVITWCNYIFQSAYLSLSSYTSSRKYIDFSNSNLSLYYVDSQVNIGEGAYSVVIKGIDTLNNNESYAIKKVLLQSKELESIAMIEIETYQKFQHKNILKLLDVTKAFDNTTGQLTMYLLFPYIKRGSLRDVLNISLKESKTRSQGSLTFILNQFISICEAINVLHCSTPSYVHQDIKPENILIDEDNIPYLIDFGSVREADVLIKNRKDALKIVEESSQYCTAPYRAPELYNPPSTGMKLDTRTDVWSVGCLLFAWWFGYSPFECEFVGDNEIKVVECSTSRILAGIPMCKNPSAEDLLIIQLVEWILEKDYYQRPYISDIIEKITAMPLYKVKNHHHHHIDNIV